MRTRKIEDFFRKLSQSELYRNINPLDLDNEQDPLTDITYSVDEFISERFLAIFPYADPVTREAIRGLDLDYWQAPYDRAYSMLTEFGETPGEKRSIRRLIKGAIEKRSIRRLIKGAIAASGENIPVWYREEGKRYFEDSHLNRLLEQIL